MCIVFLLISSGVIIIPVAASLILPPIVLLIHYCHLSEQPLTVSDHLMQPFHSGRLRDVVHLVPIMLLMLVVMLIVLIIRVVLVVTNILSHVHTLTPYGDHSTCVGVIASPTVGTNVLTCFSEVD